ncbi:hypothetical protein J6590_094213 [Homalodisca vitripennis]|nr:hypothetical protein J6590_070383 [Homalodisca vitripennis]KAG8299704.1 hypothetical protein J6590_094213 [Homalodisca vitripennis]
MGTQMPAQGHQCSAIGEIYVAQNGVAVYVTMTALVSTALCTLRQSGLGVTKIDDWLQTDK